MAEPDEITATWARYVETRGDVDRNILIVHYLPLVDRVVTKMQPKLARHAERGDLVSYGTLGLIDAMARYAPGSGAQFTTFAWRRIRGEILDNLRDYDHVDRARRQVDETQANLTARLRRTPTDAEVADELGISPDGLHRLRSKLRVTDQPIPLTMTVDDHYGQGEVDMHLASDDDPSAEWEINELRETLVAAWNSLPARERTLLSLRYLEGFTIAQTATSLGMAQSWVSEMTTEALKALRVEVARR